MAKAKKLPVQPVVISAGDWSSTGQRTNVETFAALALDSMGSFHVLTDTVSVSAYGQPDDVATNNATGRESAEESYCRLA